MATMRGEDRASQLVASRCPTQGLHRDDQFLEGMIRRPQVVPTHWAKDRRPVPDLVDRDFSAVGSAHL